MSAVAAAAAAEAVVVHASHLFLVLHHNAIHMYNVQTSCSLWKHITHYYHICCSLVSTTRAGSKKIFDMRYYDINILWLYYHCF